MVAPIRCPASASGWMPIDQATGPGAVRQDSHAVLVPAEAYVANFPAAFKDDSPGMEAAGCSRDKVMEQMTGAGPH
jgi:hypothetical protein